MCYDKFETMLVNEVKQLLPEKAEVFPKEVRKNNNVTSRAISVGREEDGLCQLIRIDDLYDEYRKGVPIGHLARLVIREYRDSDRPGKVPENFFSNYDDVKPHIFCRLVSRERNGEILDSVPFQVWEDLAVTCYYRVDPAWIDEATVQITDEHLRTWKVDERRLFDDAWKNTLRLQRPELKRLSLVLSEMTGCSEDEYGDEASPLLVLSNRERYFGAVCIAYPGETERIAERIHSDFYMLPSSVHECLILPDDGSYSVKDLDMMVCEINRTQLEEGEVLSDHVYVFREKTNAFSVPVCGF